MKIDIDKLRAAHAATVEKPNKEFRTLTNECLRGAELPVTAYEVDLHYSDQRDRPYKATISPIKITRFGVLPGCSAESIGFVSRGQRCLGSADLFYPTKKDAQAYADQVLEECRAQDAKDELIATAFNTFPALLDEIEHLRAQVSEARGLLTEFERTIDNACDGDHPCADEVRAWLEENK